eukprot:1445738-Amphidinium_carterae.1
MVVFQCLRTEHRTPRKTQAKTPKPFNDYSHPRAHVKDHFLFDFTPLPMLFAFCSLICTLEAPRTEAYKPPPLGMPPWSVTVRT